MTSRSFALKTQPRQQHRVPATAMRKSTQRHRRLMQKWPAERFAQRNLNRMELWRAQRDEKKAALALLALTNKAQHDKVVEAKRQRETCGRQERRMRNKRSTKRQAIKLLEALEEEFFEEISSNSST
jgi:hypothetical protein